MPDTNHFDEDVMNALRRDSRIIAIGGPILIALIIIGSITLIICYT